MAVLNLPVRSDFSAYGFEVDLEGTVYRLDFQYNSRLDRWVMKISDLQGNAILQGLKLLTNIVLNRQYVVANEPPGEFMCVDESGQNKDAGRRDLGNDVKLLYIEGADA